MGRKREPYTQAFNDMESLGFSLYTLKKEIEKNHSLNAEIGIETKRKIIKTDTEVIIKTSIKVDCSIIMMQFPYKIKSTSRRICPDGSLAVFNDDWDRD